MKPYFRDHPKNVQMPRHNGLIYGAIFQGSYIYQGYGHEIPDNALAIHKSDLDEKGFVPNEFLDHAVDANMDIFIIEPIEIGSKEWYSMIKEPPKGYDIAKEWS